MSLKSVTLPLERNNQPVSVFVYCIDENCINPKYVKYNSMAEVIKKEEISYNTLLLFRDTNVPFRNKLYLTSFAGEPRQRFPGETAGGETYNRFLIYM